MKKANSLKSKSPAIQQKKGLKAHPTSVAKATNENLTAARGWSNRFSSRFLSDYALPFTRLIEAKLVSLQHKI